jgi:hypothetical protein
VCVLQRLQGASEQNYLDNQPAINNTIQSAVSACFENVPPEQVTNIQVSVVESSCAVPLVHMEPATLRIRTRIRKRIKQRIGSLATLFRDPPRSAAAEDVSYLCYLVVSRDRDTSYEELSAQLEDCHASGALQENVHEAAHGFGADDLFNATLSAPIITMIAGGGGGTTGERSEPLNTVAIVGIALACVFVMLLIWALLWFLYHGCDAFTTRPKSGAPVARQI